MTGQGPVEVVANATGPAVLLQGTRAWHEDAAENYYVYQALQPGLNMCLSDSSPDGVHQSNMLLGEADLGSPPSRIGFQFAWTDEQYLGTELYAAYLGPDSAGPQSVGPFSRQELGWVDVHDGGSGAWRFWACLQEGRQNSFDNPETGPRSFQGDLTFEVHLG